MQLSTPHMLPSLTPYLEHARPRRSPHKSMLRRVLLGALALLVILSAGGFALWQHSTQTKAQNADTARIAALTATAIHAHLQATTIARADTNAEATADTAANTEATATVNAMQNLYTQSTQGIPVMNDPLVANDSNKWDEGPTAYRESCTFTKGGYHIIEPGNTTAYDCYANATNFSNFSFQVQMIILKGDEGGVDFLADSSHTNNCYFGISNIGDYNIGCYINGNYPLSLSSQKAPVGNKSPHMNLLTVIARNQHVFLYVNKRYISSFKETSVITGEIGMYAYNKSNSTEVVFNNAQVWQL